MSEKYSNLYSDDSFTTVDKLKKLNFVLLIMAHSDNKLCQYIYLKEMQYKLCKQYSENNIFERFYFI